jgi:hypothetical protein
MTLREAKQLYRRCVESTVIFETWTDWELRIVHVEMMAVAWAPSDKVAAGVLQRAHYYLHDATFLSVAKAIRAEWKRMKGKR